MKSTVESKALIVISLGFGILILSVWFGVLSRNGVDEDLLTLSLLLYWAAVCGAFLLLISIRKKWKELLLVVVSLTMALMIGEVSIRLLFPYRAMLTFMPLGQSSSQYHHVYPANQQMFSGYYVEGIPITIETNEDGLRTKYSRQEFLSYKTRVLILGDSFTFGLGVREEATCPVLLEKHLRSQLGTDDIAVLNASIVSYSLLLENELFQGVLRYYRPTTVLLFLDASDIGDDYFYAQALERRGNGHEFSMQDQKNINHYGAIYETLARSGIAKRCRRILQAGFMYPAVVARAIARKEAIGVRSRQYDYYSVDIQIDGVAEKNRFFIFRHPLEKTGQYFESTLANIMQLEENVRKGGGMFILVITPRFQHWNPNECPANWEADDYALNEPYQYEYFRFFEERSEILNFEIFNLLPAFQSTAEYPLVFNDDPHWNEKGHAFVAKTVGDYLLRERLVKWKVGSGGGSR